MIVESASLSSFATKSTTPVVFAWNTALVYSSIVASLSFKAFGLFTNNFAFLFVITVKSARDGITAVPPPHVPNIAVICGITPDACDCFT